MGAYYLNLLLLLVFFYSSTSCSNPSKNIDMRQSQNQSAENKVSKIQSNQENNGIKYFEMVGESSGMVEIYVPLPASWEKSKQEGFLYEGPNKIRVSAAFNSLFQFTNNQELLWMWQQQGIQNVPPMPLEQIIEKFFKPVAEQTGRTLTKTYPLPELANTMDLFYSQLFVSVPTQREVNAYGLEWKDNKGMSYVTALTINISYSQISSTWFFTGQYLQAPNEYFEEAKKSFLYGLTHTEANPEWVLAVYKRDAERAGKAYQAHLGRMAIINSRNNTGRSVGDVYSEILDINHAGFLKRSDINGAGHNNTINTIGERTVILNNNTGERYNVQAGSKYYWVNSEGKYFGTDNSLYDPRTDKRLNDSEWVPFKEGK